MGESASGIQGTGAPVPGLLRAEAILGLEGGSHPRSEHRRPHSILVGQGKSLGRSRKGAVCLPRGFQVGAEWRGRGHGIKKRRSYFHSTFCAPALPHSTSFKPLQSLLSRSCWAYFLNVGVEAPRRSSVSLESHVHKVDVQGSGPGTQVVCMGLTRRWQVSTGKRGMGPLPGGPLCVCLWSLLHAPGPEVGWGSFPSVDKRHRPSGVPSVLQRCANQSQHSLS